MIEQEEVVITSETLKKLVDECVAAQWFEDAVIYDNALKALNRRHGAPWPKNRPIA